MKKIMFFAFVLVLMLLLGCSGGSNTSSRAFIGGTRGLDVTFEESQPPDKVMDNGQDAFGIAVRLKNVGEAEVPSTKAVATLSGIDAASFDIKSITATNSETIIKREKRSNENIEGGMTTVDFGSASYKPKLIGDAFEVPLKVDVCYNYETFASTPLCFKKNTIQKLSGKDSCKIEEPKSVDNSGAPVQFANVKEGSAGEKKIRFTFDVQIAGSGLVYSQDTFTTQTGCLPDQNTRDRQFEKNKNKAYVIIEPPANIVVTCPRLNNQNQGEINLYDGKSATIVCEIDTTNVQDTAYVNEIALRARYMYTDFVKKTLVVTKS